MNNVIKRAQSHDNGWIKKIICSEHKYYKKVALLTSYTIHMLFFRKIWILKFLPQQFEATKNVDDPNKLTT